MVPQVELGLKTLAVMLQEVERPVDDVAEAVIGRGL